MSDTVLVEVIAGTTNLISVEVPVTPAPPSVIDVTASGVGAIGYPQLPIGLQQLPISIPVTGRPVLGGRINVPMGFAVSLPNLLAGTVVYAGIPAHDDAVFIVNRVSGTTTTELGRVTITSGSNTSCRLIGSGGALAVGEVLQIIAPLTPDQTLSDLGITLMVNRTS
jgi:hypothetical protein